MLLRKVEELQPWEVQDKLEHGEPVIIVDVREASEFIGEMGHIQGSVNVPASSIASGLGDLVNYSQNEIILVCHTGERSYALCRYLMDRGFDRVSHIRGGMVQWHLSGLQVEYE